MVSQLTSAALTIMPSVKCDLREVPRVRVFDDEHEVLRLGFEKRCVEDWRRSTDDADALRLWREHTFVSCGCRILVL